MHAHCLTIPLRNCALFCSALLCRLFSIDSPLQTYSMSGMTINRITFGLATSFGDDLTVCPAGQQLWLISKVVVEPWAVDEDDARMRLLGVRQFEGVSAWGYGCMGA